MLNDNPLLDPDDLPSFTRIRAEHLVPAIEKIIADSRRKVAEIIVSQTPFPTWDDLVLAMDAIKSRLESTLEVINILGTVRTGQTWTAAVARCADLTAAYKTQLAQNTELFTLYQALADSPAAALFEKPRQRVLQKILREYRLSGMALTPHSQRLLGELNSEIKRLEDTFKSHSRLAADAWSQHVTDEALLAGLPAPTKRYMAKKAQEKHLPGWRLDLSNEQFQMVMRYAEHRPLRKAVWVAFYSKASAQGYDPTHNNDEVLASLLSARHKKAKLLGYENFAEFALEGQMADSTAHVTAFLRNAVDEQQDAFAREARQLEAHAVQHGITEVQPWDYEFIGEKIRQDEGSSYELLREYFPLERVLSGLTQFTQLLFGVDVLERSDVEGWHSDVRCFEVREYQQAIGYLFVDLYQSAVNNTEGETIGLRNRRITAEGRPKLPIAILRSGLFPRSDDKPRLLDHQKLHVMLHEWGHCLQHLLTQAAYRDISGINGLAHDTVEFAGQFMAQWCFSKAFLTWLSSHYQTGETIPDTLLEQLMTALRTQTSWATADSLLMMLFDFEVHLTQGDGRSAQEIFKAVNAVIGHLQWPENVRPFNAAQMMTTGFAARVYSYKWSYVLASAAFEKFLSKGVFDPATGRAFREAFFARGDARSLMQSLEVFLGAPYTARLMRAVGLRDLKALHRTEESAESRHAHARPQADTAPDPSAHLTKRIEASQRQMMRLDEAVPQASAVATQCLTEAFKTAFPSLADQVSVAELSVRSVRQESIPPAERLPGGALFRHTVIDTLPLQTLFWRSLAGKTDVHERFLDMSLIEVVRHTNGTTQVPGPLNSNDAKDRLERLLNTTPLAYPRQLERALNTFWETPATFSQGHSVNDWLAQEFSTQLSTQADLCKADGTLGPPLHKAVTDYALAGPHDASREATASGTRLAVYAFHYTPADWGASVSMPGAFALTLHGPDAQTEAMLYSPGQPLEVYRNVSQLQTGLMQDSAAKEEVHAAPMTQRLFPRRVQDLRARQQDAVNNVISSGPAEDEDVAAWVDRIDAALNLSGQLDLAPALDEHQFRLKQHALDTWLHGNRAVSDSDRLAWWAAARDWREAVADLTSLPPDPATLGTPETLRNWTRTELARLIEEKYPPADPDAVFLSIRKQNVDPRAPVGASPYGSGLAVTDLSYVDDRRSLSEWAISNLTPRERNARHHAEEGPLSYEAICALIETADVGRRFLEWLGPEARQRQTEWMALKARQIRAHLWTAHISADLTPDRHNTGLHLVLAALDSPEPEGRGTVNGHEVVVHQLQWNDDVLNDVLAFAVKTPASRPSLTLYTPGAPDGKQFREVHATSIRTLGATVTQALTSSRQMVLWLISKLPLAAQADQLDSITPTSSPLTTQAKVKQVTQSIFSSTRYRARESFTSGISFPVATENLLKVLHETQIANALKTADVLTVSNAERNSTAAQEGRKKGLALLTGAMSMFPAGRMGAVLARSVLPEMVGGAAVAAIQDEGGSASQWVSDFIGGLGEVLAEGGEDLIMSHAGRRRSKTGVSSSVSRLYDPQLKPFQLKGFDDKGLVPEGRYVFRDAGGQGYLKQGKNYYKTAVQGGQRIVYAPNNRAQQRTVRWENGKWRVEERSRALGGGQGSISPGVPKASQQQRKHALVQGVLMPLRNPPPAEAVVVRASINAMPPELANRILDETLHDFDTPTINRFHTLIGDVQNNRLNPALYKFAYQTLKFKFFLWRAVDAHIQHFEEHLTGLTFTDAQKIKLFDIALPLRNELVDSDKKFTKIEMTVMPDNFTGAVFIALTPPQGKNKVALEKLKQEMTQLLSEAEAISVANLKTRFPGEAHEVAAAIKEYIDAPGNRDAYKKLMLETLRAQMKAKNRLGLLTEIRNRGIPYIVVKKGTSQQKSKMTTSEDIQRFTKDLSKYQEPFEIEPVTKVTSKKVEGTPASVSGAPRVPEAPATADTFTVTLGPLAETQMSYDNFPAPAKAKIMEILEDIRSGRATTKRINGYYWYDMAQLEPGAGRGAWRAAFERTGTTWILQGFYDYHSNKPATVWGE
ncbi:M3 family metallopeptidase [Pseudomonas mucidolens]|uniref:M3 family metallopeptidase n=1 Tax=Pseudomonas mucidolens TaxID=46679 RepID=UPI0030D836B7